MENSQEQNNSEESYVIEPEENGEQAKLCKQDKLKQEIERLKKEKEEYLEGWQRERASFANFRKDVEKRVSDFRSAAVEDVLSDLIDVMDSIRLAEKNPPKEAREDWFSVFSALEKQVMQDLRRYDVERINPENQKFDPSFHEALSQEPSDKESGTILEVVQEGYKIGERILRPARVKIAQ